MNKLNGCRKWSWIWLRSCKWKTRTKNGQCGRTCTKDSVRYDFKIELVGHCKKKDNAISLFDNQKYHEMMCYFNTSDFFFWSCCCYSGTDQIIQGGQCWNGCTWKLFASTNSTILIIKLDAIQYKTKHCLELSTKIEMWIWMKRCEKNEMKFHTIQIQWPVLFMPFDSVNNKRASATQ